MKRTRHGLKALLCSTVLPVLVACSGSDGIKPVAQSCAGPAQELFAAMQGTYYGIVDADYSTGTALPLTRGNRYVVTVLAADCSVSIAADKQAKVSFAYGDDSSGAISTLTGLSPTTITKDPTSLDLAGVQYNLGVTGARVGYELERRVKAISSDDKVADGDLFLTIYGLGSTDLTYGVAMRASDKR